jgi:YVTN family beta-propeller protein
MKKVHFFLRLGSMVLVLALGFILLQGCGRESEPDPLELKVLVVNEGNFGSANGEITSFDPVTLSATQGIFASSNSRPLAAGIQSVLLTGTAGFIFCNNADKIEIVNPETFTALRAPIEVPRLVTPRYGAIANNKLYVTCWGPYDENFNLPDSRVLVFDLVNYDLLADISVPAGPEGIFPFGGKVFVANSFTDTITVLNSLNNTIDAKIPVGKRGPTLFSLDNQNRLWTSVSGGFGGVPEFTLLNPNTNQIVRRINLEGTNANGKFVMNVIRSAVYFLGSEGFPSKTTFLYTLATDATEKPSEPLVTGTNFYGIGISPFDNTIYVGDSNAFQGEGTVRIFSQEGEELLNFPSGVGPNSFIFTF